MAKGVRYTEEFRELPLQALEQFRGGARVADDGREPEDGQRFPSCVVEDRRRRRPSGRGTRQGVDALAVRRPGGDRRGYRKGHTYPTVVRRTDPKGQLYRSWRLEEPLRLLGLPPRPGRGRAEPLGVPGLA